MADYSDLKRLADEVNAAFPDKEDLWNMVFTPTIALHLIDELHRVQAESEALRKDAERYRWLRDPDNQEVICKDSDYLMPPIICGYAEHEDVLDMESLDRAIDDAITQEPSHD